MSTPSVATIDAINSLLEAEANSIFNFVGAGSPYLEQASPQTRRSLEEMRRHLDQHERELIELIHQLGGAPSIPPPPQAEDQYLSFLSLRFLLPKLVEAKELMIQRHENALRVVSGNPKVTQVLQRHIDEMRADLEILRKSTAELLAHR